ncbi:aminotransferase class I/II-fold pyridoxal phosphate-dependent enzyme [Polyangium spumosum]|uniref:Aminotransferase class I/II-fold pyridoxal phosphate-dependent enzyme n=1 Tax=Polyangium spumosum TaxID=889282 RepID=A0A6N7Q2W4_9BACT|nr:pyridoxal phosphate-dependent aminotransferase [Polyangium spumosum]MRG98379.1 aminotransferase class I/II-fold pyridoxal phosphate-dependent enzyme [Polyangium spumosum]
MARVPFTRRTDWDRTENPLTTLLADAARSGRALVDLTESNPTRAGLVDAAPLVALLGDARGTTYAPLPLGHPRARAAVAASFHERGLPAREDRVVLSASTSEAYAWLFKLLCERGDRVLVPAPSYPLFEFLARLEDVELQTYPLVREEGFRIDLGALERAAEEAKGHARAIVLVHPNNPTGTYVRRDEAALVDAIAARHGMALIVDEVFAEYPHGVLPADRLPSFAGEHEALTFVLGGLSKSLLLPQCKLGWTLVYGPDVFCHEALARLELVADTYLSASTPVQLALPELLAARASVQGPVRARAAENLAALDRAIAAAGEDAAVRRLPTDGGWYAILEVPRTRDEDAWVESLVREHGIVVHPGYFFDMEREGFLVISLLPRPEVFSRAITSVVASVAKG